MKPIHEQEWKKEQPGVVRVSDAVDITVHVAPWRLPRTPGRDEWVAAHEVSDKVTAAVGAFPDMARALALAEDVISDVQQGNAVTPVDLETVMAAINAARRKSGVLP